jgi:hypothetical protein
MNITTRDMCCYWSLITLLVGYDWALHDHSLLIMNRKCSDTDCVEMLLIDYDWRRMISYVTDHIVSPTIDHMAAPDIDHAITPAADHDCKTQLSYQFPPYSSCWLPFKVHAPYVLFALSRFAKRTERIDGTVTCWLSPACLNRTAFLLTGSPLASLFSVPADTSRQFQWQETSHFYCWSYLSYE